MTRTCKRCRKDFEPPVRKGRPPALCDECKDAQSEARNSEEHEAKSDAEWYGFMAWLHDDEPYEPWLG